jgi:hypothetical protein
MQGKENSILQLHGRRFYETPPRFRKKKENEASHLQGVGGYSPLMVKGQHISSGQVKKFPLQMPQGNISPSLIPPMPAFRGSETRRIVKILTPPPPLGSIGLRLQPPISMNVGSLDTLPSMLSFRTSTAPRIKILPPPPPLYPKAAVKQMPSPFVKDQLRQTLSIKPVTLWPVLKEANEKEEVTDLSEFQLYSLPLSGGVFANKLEIFIAVPLFEAVNNLISEGFTEQNLSRLKIINYQYKIQLIDQACPDFAGFLNKLFSNIQSVDQEVATQINAQKSVIKREDIFRKKIKTEIMGKIMADSIYKLKKDNYRLYNFLLYYLVVYKQLPTQEQKDKIYRQLPHIVKNNNAIRNMFDYADIILPQLYELQNREGHSYS